MEDQQKLKIVNSIYAQAGPNKMWFGKRSLFDKAVYRDILFQRKTPIAFVECLYLNSNRIVYFNFGHRMRISNVMDHFKLLTDTWYSFIDRPKTITEACITTHLADINMQQICMNLGYTPISNRSILIKYKFPVDGVHITYTCGV